MPKLRLHDSYSREAVHDIFAPGTPFQAQRGTWGLHGMVAIPDRPGDFVFFVTFGQQQGRHTFDEGVTEDGVLTWQSQPRHGLKDSVIQQLIDHDDLQNTIHLFLRTEKKGDYTYLGTLKYRSHDNTRERPVYFQWQIRELPIPEHIVSRVGSTSNNTESADETTHRSDHIGLRETAPPTQAPARRGVQTTAFQTRKKPDYAELDARNRHLGFAGELLVVHFECQRLRRIGRDDLADQVLHVADIEGDGAGYDVLSWTDEGERKFIEVKTTRSGSETAFYVSSNELAFSRHNADRFYLYRIYNYDRARNAGEFYALKGDLALSEQLDLKPTVYRATMGRSTPPQ